jgi:hypothetical protein
MPELDLSLDLSEYSLPLFDKRGGSSLMSPITMTPRRSGQRSLEGEIEPEPALAFSPLGPPLPAGLSGSGVGQGLAPGLSSVGNTSGPSMLPEDSGIVDVGWEFDENGDIVETAQAVRPTTPLLPEERLSGAHVRLNSTPNTFREREGRSERLWTAQQVREPSPGQTITVIDQGLAWK